MHIQSHSDHLKRRYRHTRFTSEEEEWPMNQPKHFTSLALIHYRSGHTEREVIAFSQNTRIGDIMSPTCSQTMFLEQSYDMYVTTKDIKEIFAHGEDGLEPYDILIEGAPGIGKTVLCKEIALQWANGQLLNEILVYLIFLRDPQVQNISSIKDLVKYYYQFDESSEGVASSCAEYLLHSDGENVTFVFDGYDEYPETLRQKGFISDILQHKTLPGCRLVVTSRPHASARLRANCDRYIEIRGFTKEDRQNYIVSSLRKKQDIGTLVEYLDDHPTISSLCFIPFNMTVLLWLYKHGVVLPNSSTELYNCFICHTIRHHLAKHQISLPDNFTDLSSLEGPYRKVLQQLSFLAYKALDKNQLIFTLDEVKAVCPQIDKVPEALNGFGLLQAMQHLDIKKYTTLNFVHFSLQEFLAAYYITCLPHYEEFCVLKEHFMSEFYVDTLAMYVGMTRGQRPAFKQYLDGSSNWKAYIYGLIGGYLPLMIYNPIIMIRPGFLKNMCTCFRLFRCFHEAGDEALCSEINKAGYFSEGIISLSDTLLPSDVECLGVFLGNRQEWQGLNCYQSIDDIGFQILHQILTNRIKSTCIHELHIGSGSSGKFLTHSSSRLITEIAKCCETRVLEVSTPTLLLEDVVSLKNQLVELTLYVEENQAAIERFLPTLLYDNKALKQLKLYGSGLSDDSIEALAEALKHNRVLEMLRTPGIYHPTDAVWLRFKLKSGNDVVEIYCIVSGFSRV